ncbi:MAG: DMT family transporter [Bacteroidales bacterium]|nr:DMT family transporter [Bacteroidales bacterium]
MGHSRINISALAITSCLLWSTAFAGVKIGLQYATPLQFAGTRFFIAGLLVFPLAYRINPRYFSIVRNNLKMILLFAFLQTFLQYTMFYTGINMIPGAVAAIVIGSQPFFIALVANFMMPGDRMTLVKFLVILFGIMGVALVILGKDPQSATGHIALAGVLLMLGINVLSGFTNVLVAREKGMIPPLVISSASMIIGGAGLFLFSLPLEGFHFGTRPPIYFISLTWLSLLSAVAISIWIILLKRPGIVVSDLNMWKFLIPLFGAVFSWILLPGEQPQVVTIVGMIIITSALVVSNLVQKKNRSFIQEKA